MFKKVLAIKSRLQEQTSILAKEFGVSPSTICDIKYGRIWKEVQYV